MTTADESRSLRVGANAGRGCEVLEAREFARMDPLAASGRGRSRRVERHQLIHPFHATLERLVTKGFLKASP